MSEKVDLPCIIGIPKFYNIENMKKWFDKQGFVVASERFPSNTFSVIAKWVDGFLVSVIKVINGGAVGEEIKVEWLPNIEEGGTVVLRGDMIIGVECYFSEVIEAPVNIREVYERLMYIRSLGLKTPNFILLSSLSDFVGPVIALLKRERPYKIEGLILEKNLAERENVPVPVNKIAFDPTENFVKTCVKDVEWTTTTSGKMVPTLRLEPVKINGSIFEKINGLTANAIFEDRMGIGTNLDIMKMFNEIHIISTDNNVEPAIPAVCPYCKKKLFRREDDLYCDSVSCVVSGIKRIMFFFKKMGLKGVTKATLARLAPNSIEDVYIYFTNSSRMDAKYTYNNYQRLRRKIMDTLKNQPDKFIAGLGIMGIGDTEAKEIAAKWQGKLNQMFNVTDWNKVGIKNKKKAEIFAAKIFEFRPLYDFLINRGMEWIKPIPQIFNGIRFAISRSVPMNKADVVMNIDRRGGLVERTLSDKADYYIVYRHDKPYYYDQGNIDWAKNRGIEVVDWDTFAKMLKGEVTAVKRG